MAKRVETPTAPKIESAQQTSIGASFDDLDLVEIPGIKLSWQNPGALNQRGWGIWRPVDKESEIGEKVLNSMGPARDKFNGLNLDSSYFYRGNDCILAYASMEDYEDLMRAKAKRAEDQISSVVKSGAEMRSLHIHSRVQK